MRSEGRTNDINPLLSLNATAAILAAAILHPSYSTFVLFLNWECKKQRVKAATEEERTQKGDWLKLPRSILPNCVCVCLDAWCVSGLLDVCMCTFNSMLLYDFCFCSVEDLSHFLVVFEVGKSKPVIL